MSPMAMMEHGVIEAKAYEKVEATITENINDWAEDMRQWNE